MNRFWIGISIFHVALVIRIEGPGNRTARIIRDYTPWLGVIAWIRHICILKGGDPFGLSGLL